jgi:hypothetical protein
MCFFPKFIHHNCHAAEVNNVKAFMLIASLGKTTKELMSKRGALSCFGAYFKNLQVTLANYLDALLGCKHLVPFCTHFLLF